ncbi:MAG: family NAD(P)-dependent oxidoreductase [Solirubrobacteraceae bacterium]|nr:family NAD(P)-dependent oxidoreductase [Solirubrobacteraceae bacterium]
MEITGRTVLLTGATGGIGHAIARALHARGATLILTGRRTDVLAPLAEELSATSLAADLAQRADVDRLIADAGHADILVNNAALPASGPLLSFSVEEIDRALEVNLRAPIVLARHFAESLGARGAGHIVFISSLSGKTGQAGASLYSATKFGLRGFVQGLRGDLAPQGVGVSSVFPGFIRDAGMFHESETVLPKGVGTSTPEAVAGAVTGAIERNRFEVDVAPLSMRVLTSFAAAAPATAAKLSARMGAQDVADQMAKGQANKR